MTTKGKKLLVVVLLALFFDGCNKELTNSDIAFASPLQENIVGDEKSTFDTETKSSDFKFSERSDLALANSHHPISFGFLEDIVDLTAAREFALLLANNFAAEQISKEEEQLLLWKDLNSVKNTFAIYVNNDGSIIGNAFIIYFENQAHHPLKEAYFMEVKQQLLTQFGNPIKVIQDGKASNVFWVFNNVLIQLIDKQSLLKVQVKPF